MSPALLRAVLACALVCTCLPLAAQDVLKRIAARQQVNLGYAENAAPFSFRTAGGPSGYAVELCVAVVERLKRELGVQQLPVRFVPVDQDSVARLVAANSVDLLCAGVSDTPARRVTMAFSSPIFFSSVKLLVRSEDGPQSLQALKGRTVALLGRTTAEAAVNAINKQQGLGLQVAPVVSPEAALSQLRLHQADAWARDEVLLLGALARESDARKFTLLPDTLSTETIALAMPQDAQLQRVANEALAELARSGRLEAIYERWFVQPNPAAAAGLKFPLSPQLKAEFARAR
ncbi:amino acid ABC transporter substrate-binding protein [Ramlibacter sp. G-1-2-2]|uniref:Amino acid ABC transporter substrate-binding protein n=1 Tax=Ramlibacter agri TaxID=2728837 RepID=A0A848HBE0_9BURK|nr:amino acid ABC transporter substrate-binding protein [Ramlibacter agri]NML46819.1 amino acid ABC transporter substrate-binding protein [Ramlibacter agri]